MTFWKQHSLSMSHQRPHCLPQLHPILIGNSLPCRVHADRRGMFTWGSENPHSKANTATKLVKCLWPSHIFLFPHLKMKRLD